jgi:hypothetical protein
MEDGRRFFALLYARGLEGKLFVRSALRRIHVAVGDLQVETIEVRLDRDVRACRDRHDDLH